MLIIPATDRENSFSLRVSLRVQEIYLQMGLRFEILDLRSIDFRQALGGPYEGERPALRAPLERVAKARALVIVCPEYNGSFPGIFKYFVDHWIYPDSFIKKPVCLVGLGGRFGGLRALEHLTGLFSYRESLLFPHKVYIQDVESAFQEGHKGHEGHKGQDFLSRLQKQAQGFAQFIKAFS